MKYVKPEMIVYDEEAIKKIQVSANSCATGCTNAGCGGGSNINCGTTTRCAGQQQD